ncbi:MAG: 4Fe-4S dicluster domain-containing protein, partial [Candidatus Binatia bacterium]
MLAPSSADLWIYLALASLICAFYLGSRLRQERHSVRVREESVRARLTEPPSLHPLIDKNLCIGCGSCAAACPEQNVLGIIAGKAELIAPSHCIGHGACKEACPVGALTLVFGTATRGVDIPAVGPNFESNVPGIFIAGELGGMGLIKNAIEQGKQAMESIAGLDGIASGSTLDVVIIGAGPAGFAASLAAKQRKLRFATIEQESLGGTVAHYPRGKVVMTSPADLPLVGKVRFTETTKEKLL